MTLSFDILPPESVEFDIPQPNQVEFEFQPLSVGAEDLDAVLTEQEELIAELQDVLKSKAAPGDQPKVCTVEYIDGTIEGISDVKSFVTPKGTVASIHLGSEILWERESTKYNEKLEYIESTGTQWIDTGIILTEQTDYEFTGAITELTLTGWIAGAPIWIGVHKKADSVAITQNSGGMVYKTVGVNEPFTVGLFGDKAYFNGVETNTVSRKAATLSLFIFAYHYTTGTGTITSRVRLNSFRIYEQGTIVRDYIPVLDMESIPCLYDNVTGELFYNRGSGEFVYAGGS